MYMFLLLWQCFRCPGDTCHHSQPCSTLSSTHPKVHNDYVYYTVSWPYQLSFLFNTLLSLPGMSCSTILCPSSSPNVCYTYTSLFYIAGLCYQWLKSDVLSSDLLRSGELILLKVLVMCTCMHIHCCYTVM